MGKYKQNAYLAGLKFAESALKGNSVDHRHLYGIFNSQDTMEDFAQGMRDCLEHQKTLEHRINTPHRITIRRTKLPFMKEIVIERSEVVLE